MNKISILEQAKRIKTIADLKRWDRISGTIIMSVSMVEIASKKPTASSVINKIYSFLIKEDPKQAFLDYLGDALTNSTCLLTMSKSDISTIRHIKSGVQHYCGPIDYALSYSLYNIIQLKDVPFDVIDVAFQSMPNDYSYDVGAKAMNIINYHMLMNSQDDKKALKHCKPNIQEITGKYTHYSTDDHLIDSVYKLAVISSVIENESKPVDSVQVLDKISKLYEEEFYERDFSDQPLFEEYNWYNAIVHFGDKDFHSSVALAELNIAKEYELISYEFEPMDFSF